MKDGFLKAAALSPALRVADCAYNTRQILTELRAAAARGVKLAVFPEFCLTGYTCGDLFLQRTLQQGALTGLQELLDASRELDTVALVGLPLMVRGKLYNCAAVLCRGQLLGLVPKTYLPNYGEFYEKRQFTPGSTEVEWVNVCGQDVPFGTSLLFRCRQMPSFVLGVELCEDLWSALPPSTFHALAGATVIANLSASDETVGKAEYRRALVENQSARLLCGYLYASAGHGESTQDMVFAGHDLIAENGTLLAEVKPFAGGLAETELDCQRMESERARNTSFEPSTEGYQTVEFDLTLTDTVLTRWVDPTPFIPHNEQLRAERCELILKMQADGLARRLEHARAKTAVIGISGGLDSCLALLVAVRAMKQLGRPTTDVLAVTMPCFGTTKRTRSNAEILCDELHVSFTEIDIAATVHSHFRDIGQDESMLDVTYENGQARVRTLELMDTANRTGGLVVGTGDLSELALGWATYNGDHRDLHSFPTRRSSDLAHPGRSPCAERGGHAGGILRLWRGQAQGQGQRSCQVVHRRCFSRWRLHPERRADHPRQHGGEHPHHRRQHAGGRQRRGAGRAGRAERFQRLPGSRAERRQKTVPDGAALLSGQHDAGTLSGRCRPGRGHRSALRKIAGAGR